MPGFILVVIDAGLQSRECVDPNPLIAIHDFEDPHVSRTRRCTERRDLDVLTLQNHSKGFNLSPILHAGECGSVLLSRLWRRRISPSDGLQARGMARRYGSNRVQTVSSNDAGCVFECSSRGRSTTTARLTNRRTDASGNIDSVVEHGWGDSCRV
jgi:hypothetical protein